MVLVISVSKTLTLLSPGAGGDLLPTEPPQAIESLESHYSGKVCFWAAKKEFGLLGVSRFE